MGAASVGASALCKILLKKVEKHERIKNTAQAKMSSINGLVSDALKNNEISHEEYQVIMREHENYRELKNQIRRRVRTEVNDDMIAEAEKKGAERGKKEAMDSLLRTVQLQ